MRETGPKKGVLAASALVAGMLAFSAACGNVGSSGGGGGGGEGGGDGPTISIGSKNFTEQYILGNMYAEALENAGFNVERNLNLGSEQIADRALQSGEIDMYPEYTGTALVAIHDYGEENLAELESPEATYEAAAELYAERDPADTMLEPADFNNTYGIFVRSEVAEERNLETLEDLAEVSPELTFVSYSEFQNRSDGYPNLQENYPAMDFGDITIANQLGLRYQGIQQGDGDVGVGFTTDGQLASDELVVMDDPKNIWPFYNPAPVVRTEVLDENPEIEEVLNEVTASLDVETMRELNGQVDLEQADPADVAREYLIEEGLIEEN
ncbi:Periplasmic glycine betaine/choline-binding (lipo)protein of an ABC-type transport system (osmoprotectant binding protein) [Rubrobacter radiotolerans]|uniref:Glycine betaine ABC transporter substrate-binding protein n=1 Tax=Rubrobacter radiotolerans TaxID=42256 RepID=A0A023X1V0_RUBRA|nr:glycine betaine ABC transporter substrate-binding protein [Rubrobacter radiotolerans]AHY46176.1 Periplasmic glycine betaine/choline-binding (lipo)protein of an ABC-type transport system (osmoprotectant binding protein) [Rubrobacter radiotolerans]MDX5893586.1 glycine betaine ABC transporter substrate-binding protein [Rubrobacter radiotolerans]SMC04056.1 osmoprotectant transport system substrate-binding protein [Rubrobacter radiotolerans DSM 5868]